jgi:putative Ca2+/H+ antiporter (TMEM165/GDT1 family)
MWKTVLTTFAAVFVAELGDKTQLATLGLAAESPSRLAVFAGSASALICTSLIATLAGGVVARYVSPQWLQRAAGALFISLGVWTLWRSTKGG